MANFHVLFDGRMIRHRMHGMARHLISLINGLNEIAPENKYSVILNNRNAFEHFGDGVDIVWAKSKFMSPFELLEVPKIISRVKPDIFHNPSFLPILPRIKIPYIMTIHDLIHLSSNRPVGYLIRLYYEFMVKRACRKADMILTVSENSKNEISEKLELRKDHVSVIYNGIEDKYFKPIDPRRFEDIKAKYALPEKYVLYVGNNKPNKNIKGIIEGYLRSGVDMPLVMTVYWDEVRHYFEKSTRPANIICLGDVPGVDVHYIFRAASLFVFLSFQEGFGIPIIEAFASGIPVITSNMSSMPEVSGGAAKEIDPNDYDSIASTIREFVLNPETAQDYVRRGIERAKDFTVHNMAERVLDVYFKILPKKNLHSST
jgi:glycosyltransferase involved in cell wall biosynthesis